MAMAEKKRSGVKSLGRGLDALLGDAPSALAGDRPGAADGRAAGPKRELPIEQLKPNPDQPRRIFDKDAIEELAASIAAKGMLQPILVRPRGGAYEIVAGERRWRAAQKAQLHNVPVIIRELTDEDAAEIALFAATGTGVAHCPCSNCRLGSGIAPVQAMRRAGVSVGLGVDGSASNDAGNLVAEARQAMLLQRVACGADAMSARSALEIATRGGADVLGRPDCGRIAPGKRADLAIWDVAGIESAGSWDPAALVLAGPTTVRDLLVEGRKIVRDGQILTINMPALLGRQAELVHHLKASL